MEEMTILHLDWVEYEWDEKIYNQFSSEEHYGIYQIYGDHPVYGEKDFEKEVLILNWGERGKLLPEVSSLRYSYRYWNSEVIDFAKKLKER